MPQIQYNFRTYRNQEKNSEFRAMPANPFDVMKYLKFDNAKAVLFSQGNCFG